MIAKSPSIVERIEIVDPSALPDEVLARRHSDVLPLHTIDCREISPRHRVEESLAPERAFRTRDHEKFPAYTAEFLPGAAHDVPSPTTRPFSSRQQRPKRCRPSPLSAMDCLGLFSAVSTLAC